MEFSKENKGVSKVTRKLKAAATAAAAAKSLQSCPTLCDPIDVSPPGSTIPGILQARTLEWGAIAFSESKADLGKKKKSVFIFSLRENRF